MAKDRPPTAGELYQQARSIWAEAIDLDLYDDPAAIRRVAGLLERAVRRPPLASGRSRC